MILEGLGIAAMFLGAYALSRNDVFNRETLAWVVVGLGIVLFVTSVI